MEQQLVSICIPCYNHEKYLDDCLKSILKQTYKKIELIIIDDKSSDRSVQIIRKYLPKLNKKLQRVVFKVNKKNLGITKNCNELLKYAKGNYYKSFASDDVLAANAIEEMVDYLENNKDYNICMSNGYEVPDNYHINGSLNGCKCSCAKNMEKKLESPDFYESLLENNCIFAPGIMMKMSMFEKYGKYDEEIEFEDYEYWLRVCKEEKIGYIHKCLIYYRRSETSISNYNIGNKKKKYEFMLLTTLKIQLKYIKTIEKNKRYNMTRKIFDKNIKFSLREGYLDIAIRLYNTAKKMKISFEYNITDILRSYILNEECI